MKTLFLGLKQLAIKRSPVMSQMDYGSMLCCSGLTPGIVVAEWAALSFVPA